MDGETIYDASAWTGSELQSDRSWIHELDDGDRDQLDRALGAVKEQGLQLADIGAEQFPLCTLADGLGVIRGELEHGRGFAVVRGVDVEAYPLDDLEKLYWGICAHLGTGITQNSDASLIHYVTDGVLRPNQGTRGVGNPKQSSLHVDLTDCVSLLCVRQAPDNPSSWLASSTTVHQRFMAEHPEALEALYRGFEWDRLEENGPGEQPTTGYLVPVFSEAEGKVSCRYNRHWMARALQRSHERLPTETYHLFNTFDEIAHSVRLDVDFQPGDIQFVNNYTVLHGRDGHALVENEDHKRLLMRIWIDFDEARPMVDEAVIRYGIVRHGALGWTRHQYRDGLHDGTHARGADGRPIVDPAATVGAGPGA